MEINSLQALKHYLFGGGKFKMVFHRDPKAVMLGKVRTLIRASNKEWEFSDGAVLGPLREESIRFTSNGFQVLLQGKIHMSYEYVE